MRSAVIYSSLGSINQRGGRCRVTELQPSTDPVEDDWRNTCDPRYLSPSLCQVNTVTLYRQCYTTTTDNSTSTVITIFSVVNSNSSNPCSSSVSKSVCQSVNQSFNTFENITSVLMPRLKESSATQVRLEQRRSERRQELIINL